MARSYKIIDNIDTIDITIGGQWVSPVGINKAF